MCGNEGFCSNMINGQLFSGLTLGIQTKKPQTLMNSAVTCKSFEFEKGATEMQKFLLGSINNPCEQ